MRIVRQPDILLHEGYSKDRIKEVVNQWERKSEGSSRDYFLLQIVDDQGNVVSSGHGARYSIPGYGSSYEFDHKCYSQAELVEELYERSRKSKIVNISVEKIQEYTMAIRVPEWYSDTEINKFVINHSDFQKGLCSSEQLNVRVLDNDYSNDEEEYLDYVDL